MFLEFVRTRPGSTVRFARKATHSRVSTRSGARVNPPSAADMPGRLVPPYGWAPGGEEGSYANIPTDAEAARACRDPGL